MPHYLNTLLDAVGGIFGVFLICLSLYLLTPLLIVLLGVITLILIIWLIVTSSPGVIACILLAFVVYLLIDWAERV